MKIIASLLLSLILPYSSYADHAPHEADAPVPKNTLLVRYEHPLSEKDKRWIYYVDLISAALERTRVKYGPYELRQAPLRMVASRTFQALSENKIVDIAWGVTNTSREQSLAPIRIPLLKGLLGYRIFIIKQGAQNTFNEVAGLNDLRILKAGQGHDWADVPILQSNGLQVQTSTSYEALFSMLYGQRFDYFPRSVFEAFTEVKARPELGLTVERSLMLRYTSPTFFFTHSQNSELHKRLSEGLWAMLEDGSFDEFFENHPLTKAIFTEVNFPVRSVFQLDNPYLSKETLATLDDKRLWFRF